MNGATASLTRDGCASCSFVVRTLVPAGVPGVLPRAKARRLAGFCEGRNIYEGQVVSHFEGVALRHLPAASPKRTRSPACQLSDFRALSILS